MLREQADFLLNNFETTGGLFKQGFCETLKTFKLMTYTILSGFLLI
jgi:hypothetical protein